MNIKQIEKDWEKRNFSFGVWIDPPGQEWIDYMHDSDELFMVIEGDVELTLGGKIICPNIGEEILIPKNTMHSVKNVGSTQSRWLYGYKKR